MTIEQLIAELQIQLATLQKPEYARLVQLQIDNLKEIQKLEAVS
jgi:hypothetical protein